MAKKYGKRIDIKELLSKRPSTQVSGVPFKALSGITKLQNFQIPKGRYGSDIRNRILPLNGQTTGALAIGDAPIDHMGGMANPFYNYLLDNCITRATSSITSGTGATTTMGVIASGTDYLLRAGDTFYIFNINTFRSKLLTCNQDLLGTATTLRITSTSFTKGDWFPSGSMIVADNKLVTERASNAIEYKKYTLSNAQYQALNVGYTLLAAATDVLHIPINCCIEYIYGASENVDYDLYLGHGNGSAIAADFWGKIPSFVYRSGTNEIYDIGAFTNAVAQKNRSTNSSGEGLFLYSDAIPTSASSYIIVHLFYKSLSTA